MDLQSVHFSWQPVFFATTIILFLTSVSLTADAYVKVIKPIGTANVTALPPINSSLCPKNQIFFFGCYPTGTLHIPNPTAGCGHNGMMCANAICPPGYTMSSTTCDLVNATNSMITVMSPLKQFKSGIAIENVRCLYGFQLIGKRDDGSPACVTSNTFSKLIARGWGYDPINEFTFEGINDTYKVGQLINNFVMKFKGMGVGLVCDFPNVMINDANGKQVYQDAFGLCSSPINPPFKVHYYEHDWNGSSLAKMSLNKTGSYTIIVEMGGIGSKNFTVIPSAIAGGGNLEPCPSSQYFDNGICKNR